jgi:REP element-mobilizing transposase RayT
MHDRLGVPHPGSAGVSPASVDRKAGWHSRGYLPHLDLPNIAQMVTFRLADSLPEEAIEQMSRSTKGHTNAALRRRLEEYMDAGHGSCHLGNAVVAETVEGALLHHDGEQYRLYCWVIMPNHVHCILETAPSISLSRIIHGWKSYTAKAVNSLLGLRGRFWQPEYYDRAIRDGNHLTAAMEYIHLNPVKACLVKEAEEWRFSSAWRVAGRAFAGETPALPE